MRCAKNTWEAWKEWKHCFRGEIRSDKFMCEEAERKQSSWTSMEGGRETLLTGRRSIVGKWWKQVPTHYSRSPKVDWGLSPEWRGFPPVLPQQQQQGKGTKWHLSFLARIC